MPRRRSIFALLALACAAWDVRADVLGVRFQPHPVVESPDIRLAQLVAADGADAAAVQRLLAIRVTLAAAAGATVAVSKEEVLAHIARAAPDLVALVQWRGADEVSVARRAHELGYPGLEAAARRELQAWLDSRFEDARVAPVPGAGRAVPAGMDETAALRPVEGPVASRMAVWVDLSDGRGGVRAFPIWFAVEALRTAFVSRRAVESLGLISADDLRPEKVDVAVFRGDVVTEAGQALGFRTIVPLAAGSVLLRSQLRQAADVEAGDEVLMRISQRELHIETHAVALEQGRAGQVVHLRSPASGAILSARVAGPHLVEVEP